MSDADQTKHTTDRLDALMRMLEAEPEDAFCLYGIAQEHLQRGAFDLAVEWFDRAIAADPDHAYAYFHKARAHEAAGDDAAAERALLAGIDVARRTGDAKAEGELLAALDLLRP